MIFLLAVVGMVELSRAIMVHQVLVNCAREGARRAVVPGATDVQLTGSTAEGDSMDGVMTSYLQAAGIPATYTVETLVNGTAGSVSSAASHDQITVRVSVPYSDVSWGFLRFMPTNATLRAAVVMRKE
jgi:Flp pilus assembly protein TadG